MDQIRNNRLLTGEISVRFHSAPSDTELTGFAAGHGLRLVRRNQYVPQQAVFQPVGTPGRDVLALVRQIEREGAAHAVWANTLSAPQRS